VSNPSHENQGDGAPTILGSLLYARGAEPLVPESEWTDLVLAISERNQAAFRELLERTHRIVFTLIFRIVNDPLTAEEVALDVYHDVWRNAASFDPTRGSVIAWLMNRARSKAIDALRARNRKKRTTPGAPGDRSLDEPFVIGERRLVLEQCLEALTLDERRAIEAAYFEERSYAEVAEHLGEPLGTIKTRIRTGLAKLRTLLAGKADL